MGSLNDFRNRAAALRHLAEASRSNAVKADLIHLADRFEKLAVTFEAEALQSDTRDAPH